MMTTAQNLERIISARDVLRTVAADFGIALSDAQLTELAEAFSGIINRGTISAEIKEGESYSIQRGYYDGGTVRGIAGGGNYTLQSKGPIVPTKSQQTIYADDVYYGLLKVTLGAIPSQYNDTSDVTAAANQVLSGEVIVGADGKPITGTMPNNGTVNAQIKEGESYTVKQGYYDGGVIQGIAGGGTSGGIKQYCWMRYSKKPTFPYGITPVEYIKTSGTQYFKIDYNITSNKQKQLKIEADMAISESASKWRVSGTGIEEPYAYIGLNPNSKYAYGNNGDNVTNINGDNNRHIWVVDYVRGIFSVDGTTLNTFSYVERTGIEKAMYISGYSASNTHSETICCYRFYENDVIVREYIPCILFDNTPILYETVNGTVINPSTVNGITYGNVSNAFNSEFLGYVTSDDSDNYPNNAYHTDGYWYVKVENTENIPRAESTKF